MGMHFVYDDCDRACLYQGDVLRRSDKLLDLLGRVHPHYASHPSYKYFLVLTQSCDLVRRNGDPPSSPYITIAAVRPVEEAIRREAKAHQEWWQIPTKSLGARAFDRMVLITESLFDNNADQYFYLHEDLSLGITGSHCAFLALSVALKAAHYDLCLEAKIAQLKEAFRAKLGWMVGKMYSRVGTQEWDEAYGPNNARHRASSLLRGLFVRLDEQRCGEGLRDLESKKALKEYSPEEILQQIMRTLIVPRQTRVSNRAKEVLGDFHFIDRICSRVIRELREGPVLREHLGLSLTEAGLGDPEAQARVRDLFLNVLTGVLSDEHLADKEKVVEQIVGALLADTALKAALT
jgi:hypothetical protein